MRAASLARADARSNDAPSAFAPVSLARASSDDASTDAAVDGRFAAGCVPSDRDDASRAETRAERVGSKLAPSPLPLSRVTRHLPRPPLPPIFALDGATSACEVRLVLDPPEVARGPRRLRLPRLRANPNPHPHPHPHHPDPEPRAPSPSRETLATAERAARRARRRQNRRATDDPRVDALLARVDAVIAAARNANPKASEASEASSPDRLDRRPRSVSRDRDRDTRNSRDPNPPLAWIRRLVAYAESSPVFEPPAPGEPPPVYDRAAGAWIRALFPSTRDAVATRADVRLLERWLEQTMEGILDDDGEVADGDADAEEEPEEDDPSGETDDPSGETDTLSAPPRVRAATPSFASVATLCDGALWAHRAAFDALLRRVSSECRDRGRLLSRVWTRTVALVDARARADAESRWVAERARRFASETDAAVASSALAETRSRLEAETIRRRDETEALEAAFAAASRRAETIAKSLRDAGGAESRARAAAESLRLFARTERASRVAAESTRDAAVAAADASRVEAADARTALATFRIEASRAARAASVRISETRETAIRVAGELEREIARGVVAETVAETVAAETSAALARAETRADVAERDASNANRRAEDAETARAEARRAEAEARAASAEARAEAATERSKRTKAEAAFVAAADARDAETARADAAESKVETLRETSRRRLADAVAARVSAEADAAAANRAAEDARRDSDDARDAAKDAEDEIRSAAARLAELERRLGEESESSHPPEKTARETARGDADAMNTTRTDDDNKKTKKTTTFTLADRLGRAARTVASRFRAASVERDALVRARVAAETSARAAESSARRADARLVDIGAAAETSRRRADSLERRAEDAERTSDALARRLAETASTAETLRADLETNETALRDAIARASANAARAETAETMAAIREEEVRVAAERVASLERRVATAEETAETFRARFVAVEADAEACRDALASERTARIAADAAAATADRASARLAEETVAVRLRLDDATRERDALATRPTRAAANRLRLRASLLSVTCGRLRRDAAAVEAREAKRSAEILSACKTREMALVALARDFAEGETRAILASLAAARDARNIARDAAKDAERISGIRNVTDARLRRFDVARATRKDAAAQCDDASCRAWIDRATRLPVVETGAETGAETRAETRASPSDDDPSSSLATVRIPPPTLLDPRLVGRVVAETCATRLRLREGPRGVSYRLEPRDPRPVTVFDCLSAAVDALRGDADDDAEMTATIRLLPARALTVDSVLASARYHAHRGDAKCAALARFAAMTPSTGAGFFGSRVDPSRLDAADPATRSAAFEAHCAFLDCARRLCSNVRGANRAAATRGSNRGPQEPHAETLRALAPWREGAVAVTRDDALDVFAAACNTHAPERLPAWRRAVKATERARGVGGVVHACYARGTEVDLDALLETLVDAWARGEAPADWATAPRRRRGDEDESIPTNSLE